MSLEIVINQEAEILHTICEEVQKFDKSLKKLVKEMTVLMQKAKGLGLAAPQVGLNMRFVIVVLDYSKKIERILAMVNPELTYMSEEEVIGEEGCLSLPGTFGNVKRSEMIIVKYQDLKGKEQTLKLSDMDARVVQHEIDHLNGKLFIEKLTNPLVM